MSKYVWIPGRGPDKASLERMRRAFPRPAEPPGEAWFMGERRMFPELMGDLGELSVDALQTMLCEIASGPACFGPLAEWTKWYHYLLPRLIPRAHETAVPDDLLEILMTGFFTQYPLGLDEEPYTGFHDDALATLGQSMMTSNFWIADHPNLKLFFNQFYGRAEGCWSDAGRKFSASFFFCVKYLDADAIGHWMGSVLAIRSTHWRAQLLVWFIGAHRILTGEIRQPSSFGKDFCPQISWDWSHCLNGKYPDTPSADFLPPENCLLVLQAAQKLVADGVIADWMNSISRYDHLEQSLAGLPDRFAELYGVSKGENC